MCVSTIGGSVSTARIPAATPCPAASKSSLFLLKSWCETVDKVGAHLDAATPNLGGPGCYEVVLARDAKLANGPKGDLQNDRDLAESLRRKAEDLGTSGRKARLSAGCRKLGNVVQPDLLFVSLERAHLLSEGEKVRGALDLEILSPSTADKDRGSSASSTAGTAFAEYWLVDPMAETVSIHRQREGELTATRTFSREETLRSPLLAHLELHLDDVFSP